MSVALSPADVDLLICGSALGAHPGAEAIGIVQAAGESAAHLVGRCVAVPRLLPCGECDLCRRGRIAVCAGQRPRPLRPVDRERVPARFLLPLEPPFLAAAPATDAAWRYAALSDALLAPYSGLIRAGQSPGGLCVVLGGGPRAAAAVLIVRALGCQAAVLCPRPDERDLLCAPPYAALTALDPAEHDADSARRTLRDLATASGLPPHELTLIETTGSDPARARALSLLEKGGTAILLDRSRPLDHQPAPLPLSTPLPADPSLAGPAVLDRITNEQCQVLGAGPGHPDLLPELLALVERSQLDLTALTRPISLSAVDAELTTRRTGHNPPLTLPIAIPSSVTP